MRRGMICLALLLLLLGTISNLNAQDKQQPMPEEIQQQMQMTMGMMIPYMAKMIEVGIESLLTVLSKPEAADKMARYVRNFQEALIKQGFSKEEALRIVTSLSLPSATASPK